MALQSLLRKDIFEQLNVKLMELKDMQSKLELRNNVLITMYEQQTKTTAEHAQLRTQCSNKTAATTESESVVMESEQPATRKKWSVVWEAA